MERICLSTVDLGNFLPTFLVRYGTEIRWFSNSQPYMGDRVKGNGRADKHLAHPVQPRVCEENGDERYNRGGDIGHRE